MNELILLSMAGISECSALYNGLGYIDAMNFRTKIDRKFKIPPEYQNQYVFDEDHEPKKPRSRKTESDAHKLGSFDRTKLDPKFKLNQEHIKAYSRSVTKTDLDQYNAWVNDKSITPNLMSDFESVDDYIRFMDYYKDSHLTLEEDPAVLNFSKMKRTFSTTDKEVYEFSPNVDIEYSEDANQGLDFDHVIGSILMSVTYVHMMHLCTKDYPAHMALDDYYNEMPDKVDALAEHFLADNAACMLCNCITPSQDPIDYLERLKSLVSRFKPTTEVYEDASAYQSQLDDVLNLISSTLYKLRRLATPKRTFSME